MCVDDGCGVRTLIFGCIFGLFGLIGMLCMTAGYVANTNNNNALVSDVCATQGYTIVSKQCSYTCYCDSKGNNCRTCYYTCFDGFIFINITDIVNMYRIYVLTADHVADVNNYLSFNYPVGRPFTCYRTTQEPIDVRLTKYDANSSFIAGLVFLSLAAVILIVWIIVECCFSGPEILACLCFGICSRCSEYKIHRRRMKLEAENRKRLEEERLEEEERKARVSFAHDVEQPPTFDSNLPPYNPDALGGEIGEIGERPSAPSLTESQMTHNIV